MPSGNLTVVDNMSGVVVATGCRTIKQAEREIYDYLCDLANNDEDSEMIERSFSAYSPYKKFGECGIKGYAVSRDELLSNQETEETEEVVAETPVEETEVEDNDNDFDLEDLDLV